MIDPKTRTKIVEIASQGLPGSKLVQLGTYSLNVVFQYVESSTLERLVVLRDSNNELVGFSLISMSPRSLVPRLLRNPKFLFSFVLNFWRIQWHMPSFQKSHKKNIDDKPEAIFICITASYRGQGWGSKLIAEIEAKLKKENINEYTVKTEAKDNEQVIEFYLKNGFIKDDQLNFSDSYFIYFKKKI